MEIVGNEFGNWEFNWTSGGLTFDSLNLFQGFKVIFKPKPAVPGSECGKIAFVQTLKILDKTSNTENVARIYSASAKTDRLTADDWFLDREVDYSSPWYGLDNYGNPRSNLVIGKRTSSELVNAVLTDMPQAAYSNAIWTFETCVGCIPSSGPAKFFGGLRNIQFEFYGGRRHDLLGNQDPANPVWVTRVDQTSFVTGRTTPEHFDVPSAHWRDSADCWNEQAIGSTTMKNHPNQQQLSLPDAVPTPGMVATPAAMTPTAGHMERIGSLSQQSDWKVLADLLLSSAAECQRRLDESRFARSDAGTVESANEIDELEIVQALGKIGNSETVPALQEFRQIKSQDMVLRSGEFWATIDSAIENIEFKQ